MQVRGVSSNLFNPSIANQFTPNTQVDHGLLRSISGNAVHFSMINSRGRRGVGVRRNCPEG